MSKYAIVKLAGFQYTLEEGKHYELPNFEAEEGKNFEVKEVLAIGDGEKLIVGKPLVDGAKVTLKISEQGKGEKIKTRIYKAKSRYHKTTGFRKRITKFSVEKIVAK